MEKLELKHLAPYLPYGLKVLTGKSVIRNMVADFDYPTQIRKEITITQCCRQFGVKPILKPLSYLENHEALSDLGAGGLLNLKADIKTIDVMTFRDVVFLLENRFDIFGLIDKGLAISYLDVQFPSNVG